MSQITNIRPQKKLRHGEPRFNIYLDGKFSFALPAETLMKAGLTVNQILSQEEIDKLVKDNEFDKFYNGVLRLLSFRPHSQKEIFDWFEKKEVGESVGSMIIKKLSDLGYLNDEEFVKWWIEQRQTFKPKGKRALEMELRQKGISPSLISNFQFPISNETELAKKAIEKKLRLWKNLSSDKFRQKLTSFLAQRGFSWETIEKVVDEIGQKE